MSRKAATASVKHCVLNVTWSKSSEVMQANFFKFLERKAFSDCTLEAEGRFIYAHRLVLASSSLFFEKLFTSRSAEKHSMIHLSGISYMNLCLIMKYAYTGEASMAENRLQSFLDAAKTLKMFGLMEDYESHQKLTKRKRKKKSKPMTKTPSQVTGGSLKRQSRDPPVADAEPKRVKLEESSKAKTPKKLRKRISRPNDPPILPSKKLKLDGSCRSPHQRCH